MENTMRRLLPIFTAFALLLSPSLFAQSATDIAEIEKTVNAYFEGNGTANRALLTQAFAEEAATMVGALKNKEGETEIRVWKDMSQVLDNWANNENPGGANRDGEILNVNVVGGRLATVIFRYTDQFYDAFSLVKMDDGSWKIASKTFIVQ